VQCKAIYPNSDTSLTVLISTISSGYINIGTIDFTNTFTPSIKYQGVSFNVNTLNRMYHAVFKGSATSAFYVGSTRKVVGTLGAAPLPLLGVDYTYSSYNVGFIMTFDTALTCIATT
jgi:hypothetical protein